MTHNVSNKNLSLSENVTKTPRIALSHAWPGQVTNQKKSLPVTLHNYVSVSVGKLKLYMHNLMSLIAM